MNRLINWLFGVLQVPTEPPAAAEGARVLDARHPSQNWFRLQMVTWTIFELGGLLLILALLLTQDLPLLPEFAEKWLRFFLKPDFWEEWFDEIPSWLVHLKSLNPLDGVPNLVVYGYALQALSSLLLILSKWKIRTSWFVVDEIGVRTRTGLFTIQEKNADFSRIQSLIFKSSLLQGFFGMADIEFHTASASSKMEDKDKTTLAIRNIDNARHVYALIQEQLQKTVKKTEARVAEKRGEEADIIAARRLLAEAQNLRNSYGNPLASQNEKQRQPREGRALSGFEIEKEKGVPDWV